MIASTIRRSLLGVRHWRPSLTSALWPVKTATARYGLLRSGPDPRLRAVIRIIPIGRSQSARSLTTNAPDLPPFELRARSVANKRLPLSPEALKLAQDIRSGAVNPFEALPEMLAQDEAKPHIVRVCLLGAKALVFNRGSRRASKEWLHSLEPSFAASVLQHIWSRDEIWSALLRDDAATWALCYFAIAEDLQYIILQWMAVNVDLPVDSSEEREENQWRSALLRQLMTAHAYHEENYSLDAALTTFFQACDRKTEQRRERSGPLRFLSLFPAVMELSRLIKTGIWYKTSPELFEGFQILTSSVTGNKVRNGEELRSSTWNNASLSLYHPSQPDAAPALEHLQLRKKQNIALPALWSEKKAMRTFKVRTRAVAIANNEHETGSWVSEEFQRLFEDTIPYPERYHGFVGSTGNHEDVGDIERTVVNSTAEGIKLSFGNVQTSVV